MRRGCEAPMIGLMPLKEEEETPEFLSLPSEQEVVICTLIFDLQSPEPGEISICVLSPSIYGIWL